MAKTPHVSTKARAAPEALHQARQAPRDRAPEVLLFRRAGVPGNPAPWSAGRAGAGSWRGAGDALLAAGARAQRLKVLGYRLHYWRTTAGDEVDFVLYGERGLRAFEVKMADTVRTDDLRALLRFRADFPQARAQLLHLGNRRWHDRGVEVLPFLDCVTRLDRWL
jgi:hypothetical protein